MSRCVADSSDFIEGVRAALVDRDRRPWWRGALADVSEADVSAYFATDGADLLPFENV